LKKVRSGKDLSRVEILGDSLTPEHEAFAVKSHLGFSDAFENFKEEPGFTHLPEFDHFEDGFMVAMFRVDGFDTALQLIFRNHDRRIFEPEQVFGEE
jgi:hypothetical protein